MKEFQQSDDFLFCNHFKKYLLPINLNLQTILI
jgi:hypothetical protein